MFGFRRVLTDTVRGVNPEGGFGLLALDKLFNGGKRGLSRTAKQGIAVLVMVQEVNEIKNRIPAIKKPNTSCGNLR